MVSSMRLEACPVMWPRVTEPWVRLLRSPGTPAAPRGEHLPTAKDTAQAPAGMILFPRRNRGLSPLFPGAYLWTCHLEKREQELRGIVGVWHCFPLHD